jgi:DNA-binding PadR family transcriptional regulator
MDKFYPAVKYLERLEYVVGEFRENSIEDNLIRGGARRRYYRLTPKGYDLYNIMTNILLSEFSQRFSF